jgi:hypothetical protein
MMYLVQDLDRFRTDWEYSGDILRYHMTSSVSIGEAVEAVFIFRGCSADDSGNCQLFAETSLLREDGSTLEAGLPKPIWAGRPPPESSFMGQTSASIAPKGEPAALQVRAIVTDRVANKRVVLAVPLQAK